VELAPPSSAPSDDAVGQVPPYAVTLTPVEPPAPPPTALDYQFPTARDDAGLTYVGMPALFGATVAFAATVWMVDYALLSHRHLRGVAPGTYAYVKALDDREWEMMAEGGLTVICSVAFLIVQGLLRPNAATRVRPHAWLIAVGAGLTYCLTRWLISLSAFASLPGWADFCVAIVLAVALATAVSFYRWPRGLSRAVKCDCEAGLLHPLPRNSGGLARTLLRPDCLRLPLAQARAQPLRMGAPLRL
jgi:hypothetical protein